MKSDAWESCLYILFLKTLFTKMLKEMDIKNNKRGVTICDFLKIKNENMKKADNDMIRSEKTQ